MIGAKKNILSPGYVPPRQRFQRVENQAFLNPGGLTGADDIQDWPSYMQPYVGNEDHPVRASIGIASPDISRESKDAQSATPRTGAPITQGSVQSLETATDTQWQGQENQTDRPLPRDPLTGEEIGGVRMDATALLIQQTQILDAILGAVRMQNAQLPCRLEFDGNTTDLSNVYPKLIRFKIHQKTVPALRLMIQNNTPSNLYIDMVHNAQPGSLVLVPGGLFNEIVITDTVSLLSAGVGPFVINGAASGGVFVSAWSNPEWTKMWGQI